MSPRLPIFKPLELIRLLEEHGFRRIDQTGSHVKMHREDENITVIVPNHKGKDVHPGLANAILRQAGIDAASMRR